MRIAVLFSLLSLWIVATPQSYFYKENIIEPNWLLEAGAGVGIINCLTDLGGKPGSGWFGIDLPECRKSYSIFAVATFRQLIGFRIQFFQGKIGAADSVIGSGKPGSRFDRNLHFRSNISEASILLEFYPFALSKGQMATRRLQPFIQTGFGCFKFNPQAFISLNWVDLQPLRTEGQGFSQSQEGKSDTYSLTQLDIPIGMGLRWEAGPFVHFRLEGLCRILFTDYLDDVSTVYCHPSLFRQYLSSELAVIAEIAADRRKTRQAFSQDAIRGNPRKNDSFFHLQIACSLLLNRK